MSPNSLQGLPGPFYLSPNLQVLYPPSHHIIFPRDLLYTIFEYFIKFQIQLQILGNQTERKMEGKLSLFVDGPVGKHS